MGALEYICCLLLDFSDSVIDFDAPAIVGLQAYVFVILEVGEVLSTEDSFKHVAKTRIRCFFKLCSTGRYLELSLTFLSVNAQMANLLPACLQSIFLNGISFSINTIRATLYEVPGLSPFLCRSLFDMLQRD